MPIARPISRDAFLKLGYPWLTHITLQKYLLGQSADTGIVREVVRRDGDWAECRIDLRGTSGFGNHGRRLLRDYSLVDFELKLKDRGSYTYFFAGPPSGWGLLKNIGNRPLRKTFAEHGWSLQTLRSLPYSDEAGLLADGFAIIRVATPDLLAEYDGPLFWRFDDRAVVMRGSYSGLAQVTPLPIA